MKTCTKCGVERPPEEFRPKHRACRPCQRQDGRIHYQANKAQRQEYGRNYARAHRAERRLYDAAYYQANRERRMAAALTWRAENRDRWAVYSRLYRENNPEQFATYYRARYGRRVAGALPFSATQLDARMSMFGRRCWMCGGPFEHVDHVKPLAKGGRHMLANLRPACGPCNGKKRDRWTGVRGISTLRRTPCR